MKADVILYSRTLTKDYRWLFVPKSFSDSLVKKLKKIYDQFDDRKSLFVQEFPPLFCLNHKEDIILLTIHKTEYKDSNGRPILCMQGLSFNQTYFWDLKYILPFIVDNYKDNLFVWKYIDTSLLDTIEYQHQQIDLSIEDISRNVSERFLTFKELFIKKNGSDKSDYPSYLTDLLNDLFTKDISSFSIADECIVKKVFPSTKCYDTASEINRIDGEVPQNITNELAVYKRDEIYNSDAKENTDLIVTNKQLHKDLMATEKSLPKVYHEFSEISIGRFTPRDLFSILQKAINIFLKDDQTITERSCIIVKNIESNNVLYIKELPSTLNPFDKTINNYFNPNNNNNIILLAELNIISEKLSYDGWKRVSIDENPWWNYRFQRQLSTINNL